MTGWFLSFQDGHIKRLPKGARGSLACGSREVLAE
jgi:hypothetical protein